MEQRIGTSFPESCNSFVLSEHRHKPCSQAFTALGDDVLSRQKGRHLTVLIIVKHWHFCLAAPAPEHFHCR